MIEGQVMSANAVRGYIEESLLPNLNSESVRISTFTEGSILTGIWYKVPLFWWIIKEVHS